MRRRVHMYSIREKVHLFGGGKPYESYVRWVSTPLGPMPRTQVCVTGKLGIETEACGEAQTVGADPRQGYCVQVPRFALT